MFLFFFLLQLVILVVMPKKSQIYSNIKTYCETMHRVGVMTQCALSKNISRPNKQYCGNLGLKINTKVGADASLLLYFVPVVS
jgi:eukaryotic translation initiation factor 2C